MNKDISLFLIFKSKYKYFIMYVNDI